MSKNKNAYKLGQKFFNPINDNKWLIYFTQYDHEKKQWRYCMIKVGSQNPVIIGKGNTEEQFLYHEKLERKVIKGLLILPEVF